MIRNVTKKTVLHKHPVWATSMMQQAIGLMFRRPRSEGVIFLFMPARKDVLQMWFVFASIDVLILDGSGKVLALRTLRPWQMWAPKLLASCIVEVPAGTIAKSCTEVGDTIALPQMTQESIWKWWHYALFMILHLLFALAIAALLFVTIVK
jgi:uncharacterized membrane protein (UPF0127 family)